MLAVGSEAMPNANYSANDGVTPTYFPERASPKLLYQYSASWELSSHTRTFALIVADMQNDYRFVVDHVVPNAVQVLEAFRRIGQPVVWTDYARQEDDGAYGAHDRFYGPRGVYPHKGHMENPTYMDVRHDKDAVATIEELAPKTDAEASLLIKSMHLSKFADRHEDGSEILYPMLKRWGVDTIVIIGSWTESCVMATALEATDRYGLDVVLVKDAIASASAMQRQALDLMGGLCAKVVSTDELVMYLGTHPDKIKAPRAALRYSAVAPDVEACAEGHAEDLGTNPAKMDAPYIGSAHSAADANGSAGANVDGVIEGIALERYMEVASLHDWAAYIKAEVPRTVPQIMAEHPHLQREKAVRLAVKRLAARRNGALPARGSSAPVSRPLNPLASPAGEAMPAMAPSREAVVGCFNVTLGQQQMSTTFVDLGSSACTATIFHDARLTVNLTSPAQVVHIWESAYFGRILVVNEALIITERDELLWDQFIMGVLPIGRGRVKRCREYCNHPCDALLRHGVVAAAHLAVRCGGCEPTVGCSPVALSFAP